MISRMLVYAMGCGSMTGLSAAYVSLGGSLYDYVDEYYSIQRKTRKITAIPYI